MNPVFFIPFLLAPMVNAVLAWAAMKLDLIGRVISVVPWTAQRNWRRLGAGLGFPGGDSGHCSGLRVGNHLLPIL